MSETKTFRALNGKGIDVRLVIQIGTMVIVGVSMYFALKGEVDIIKVEMKNDREKIVTFVPESELNLKFDTIDGKLNKLLTHHGIQ